MSNLENIYAACSTPFAVAKGVWYIRTKKETLWQQNEIFKVGEMCDRREQNEE
jgi:hypothetical protein